jgi:hypothetical protein
MKRLKQSAIDRRGRIGNDAAFFMSYVYEDRVGRRSSRRHWIGKIGTGAATLGKRRLAR